MNDNYCVPGSPNEQYEGNYNKGGVTVGCGCKTFKDIVNFAKEKRIEYADLTYADEMGLWHHIVVPMADLAMTVNPDFGVVTTKDGKILRPDPLSAKVSPFSHPNVMFVTCMDVSYDHVGQERGRDERVSGRDLKTKQLNPNLVEMVQRRMMETQTRQSGEIERLLNNEEQPQMGFYQKPGDNFIEWKMVSKAERNRYSPPTTPPVVPGSPEDSPNQFSDSSPTESPTMTSSVPSSMTLTMNLQNLKMKLPMEGFEALDLPPGYKPPPLLRPRQVHPCKNKLDDKKSKKRKIMEHMFCRHCGAKDTPEWRRGPDGRKSLCNACGLHYSKVVKKETMTVSAGRTVSVHSLLNPA